MQPGQYYLRFDYLDDSYKKRTAYLTAPHWPTLPALQLGTSDPQWLVVNTDENNALKGPFDFLTYVGADNQFYHVQVHAEHDGGANDLTITLSHELRDGGGGFSDSTDFTIRDWNNKPVHLEISSSVPNDVPPCFKLYHT